MYAALKTCSGALAIALCSALASFGQDASAWRTECSSTSTTSPLSCRATHRLVTEGNQVLFDFTIIKRQTVDAYQLLIRGPLGFYLPSGIQVRLDGTDWKSLEINQCTSDGCFSTTSLEPAELKVLGATNELVLRFSPQAGKDASVTVPTQGLFDSLQLISDE